MIRRPCLDCAAVGPWKTDHGIRCPRCHRTWERTKAATHRYSNRPTGSCAECGARGDLTWDHVRSVSRGGTSTPDNLRVLCRRCNGRKGRLQDRLR